MRWIPFLIAAYVLLGFQVTLGKVLTFSTAMLGQVGPDFAAIFAVFVALNVRTVVDALLAGWVLGMSVDLLAAGGVAGGSCAGIMSLTYMVAAGVLFWIREAFFRDRPLTQAILAVLFCLIAHGLWVGGQAARAGDWAAARRMLPQMLCLAAYTGVLTPLVHLPLLHGRRFFLAGAAGEAHPRHGRW